jgi:hypothetical protein
MSAVRTAKFVWKLEAKTLSDTKPQSRGKVRQGEGSTKKVKPLLKRRHLNPERN